LIGGLSPLIVLRAPDETVHDLYYFALHNAARQIDRKPHSLACRERDPVPRRHLGLDWHGTKRVRDEESRGNAEGRKHDSQDATSTTVDAAKRVLVGGSADR
jgi:hypothetical protein